MSYKNNILSPEVVKNHFLRDDGKYLFARWARPIAPVAFGVDDQSLACLKRVLEAVVGLVGHEIIDTDPELGSNMIFFFFEDWEELIDVPHLHRLVPNLIRLKEKLASKEANQYRLFRFDAFGAIKACFIFCKMDYHLRAVSAETLFLSQVVQSILLWSDRAFQAQSPLVVLDDGDTILRPEIADLIKVAYTPELPAYSESTSHSLRLFARIKSQLALS